jgi:adenylosuccinate lyase
MVGRTHGQQALPLTFGYKCAVWVDEIGRQLARCAEAEARVFTGNITGAVGTMASFGPKGREMQALALSKLDLAAPNICWHSARDRICEVANLMTQIAGTFGKIAREIYALQQGEFGEVAEPHHHGKIGSSTMPHKRNPATVELSIGLSRLIRAQQSAITDAVYQEHERYSALLRIELAAVPEMMIYTGSLLAKMRGVVEHLQVYPARMRRNLDMLGGLLLSENVMLALGKAIGKQTAHEVVYEIAMHAHETETPFRDALLADARVSAHLDAAAIEVLLDPVGYIGESERIVDDVLARM